VSGDARRFYGNNGSAVTLRTACRLHITNSPSSISTAIEFFPPRTKTRQRSPFRFLSVGHRGFQYQKCVNMPRLFGKQLAAYHATNVHGM
jgi:hypothetical protein